MKFLKRIWEIYWKQWTWPLKLGTAGGLVLLILLIILGAKYCKPKAPVIDQAAVDKINNANRKERQAELQNQIEKNADVIKTVDNRTTIAETNVVERNAAIDEKVKEADKKIEAAKQQGHDVTGPELDCILTGENCQ